MNKIFIFIFIIIFLNNCNNQTIYSGKILSQDSLNDINFENKDNLLKKFGYPSYIDPVTNKFFYFSEMKEKKSIFEKKTNYSLVFVFEFDEKDNILKSKVYNLENGKNIELVEDETSNDIIRRGLLERIFGGVGPQTELPTTP